MDDHAVSCIFGASYGSVCIFLSYVCGGAGCDFIFWIFLRGGDVVFRLSDKVMEDGGIVVWLIFLSSWGCDTCAYCVGVLFGKHKMAPKLSPKKSVEGGIGGIVGGGSSRCIICIGS